MERTVPVSALAWLVDGTGNLAVLFRNLMVVMMLVVGLGRAAAVMSVMSVGVRQMGGRGLFGPLLVRLEHLLRQLTTLARLDKGGRESDL